MRLTIIALAMLVSSAASAQTDVGSIQFITTPSSPSSILSIAPSNVLSLTGSGGKCKIIINMETGGIEHKGECDVDDAAKTFWSVLMTAFPTKERKQ